MNMEEIGNEYNFSAYAISRKCFADVSENEVSEHARCIHVRA